MPFLYYEIKEEFKNSGMDLEKEIVDYAKVHIKKEFYVPSYFSEIDNIPYTEGEKKIENYYNNKQKILLTIIFRLKKEENKSLKW